MFALHDRTRRKLCRAAFALACVVPTLGVLAWAGMRASDAHRAACAAQLSRAVGLTVSLGGVSYPRPAITLYDNVELADPESGAPLARARFLEAGGGEGVSAWVASQPELDATRLRQFWQLIDGRLRQAAGGDPIFRFTAAEATLHWPDGAQTLTEILGQLDGPKEPDSSPAAALTFRVAGLDAPEPVRIKIIRQRQSMGAAAKTTIELNTGGAALPLLMLTEPLGVANHLGERARFRGTVWASETSDGWEGELSGEFTEVDLQAVVTEQFPHRMSGAARIAIQKARFRHGRLESASGTFLAGPGAVSRSLLVAADEHLHLVPDGAVGATAAAQDPNDLLGYEQFRLAWTIDSAGLTLRGQCTGGDGVVLQGRDGVLVRDGGLSLPVTALLRTLVPQSEVQVPATRQSDWLMDRLPVPDVMPPTDWLPQGRLRLRPRSGGT